MSEQVNSEDNKHSEVQAVQTEQTAETQKSEEERLAEKLKSRLKPQTKGDATRTDYDIRYEHDKTVKKKFKLRIVYNKKGCVSSGHCILSDPFDFELNGEFKAILKGGKEQEGPVKGIFIKEIETDEPHLVINAAKTCTPKVIAIIDMETGKRIAP